MVGHIVDGNHFLLFTCHNPCDVLLQFIIVFGPNKILPAFYGKYDVNVDLRVRVRHPQMMPLLTELGNLFWMVFYRYTSPTGFAEMTDSVRFSVPQPPRKS